jgi:hypothetical protein
LVSNRASRAPLDRYGGRVSEGPRTALVIPVPELSASLPDPAIALFDPFLPRHLLDEVVLRELTELFSVAVPFTYELGEPARFPSGRRYLPPHPSASFRHLVHEVRREFPDLLPPTRSLEAAVPHLPVPDDLELPGPATARARTAELWVGEPRAEETLAVFRFGTSAA